MNNYDYKQTGIKIAALKKTLKDVDMLLNKPNNQFFKTHCKRNLHLYC